ncbi:hypothetical protein AKG07_14255 [Microbacterium sp. CGR1]|nr:hypothetical protein AKG07_14255 [Microbacterium sp. CGR1]AQY00326.1 hypothetical protein B2G67_01675 [Microbacterium foliorum]KIP93764.1 hypothetical protein RU09_05400 [Microbacterium sp. MEJ108Y]MBC6493462.1 hypothetical protein [Microbacterium sp. 4-7]
MIGMASVPTVALLTGVLLRSTVLVAHRRVVVLRGREPAVIGVRGLIGVLVVLAHRNSLLGCARVKPGADR